MWYQLLVFVLFALAVIDLVVGVSNDAANFLNSAIGSKVATVKTILIIASIGVLAGAVASEGMMEVARKGIFVPGYFSFDHIMMVFLAVMITDIILLDVYNSFGLPTSTTVSIVFELLGSAFVIGTIVTLQAGRDVVLDQFINLSTASKIISGIFLSVLVAFSSGALVQFLIRTVFTFDLDKGMKRFGPLFTGIALTAITYFLLIKGLKGSSLLSEGAHTWIQENTLQVLSVSVVVWFILAFILQRALKVNLLRLIVLMGTFSLAMAFAGNDLVNFIGVSVAGWQSFQAWTDANLATGIGPDSYLMNALASKGKAPIILLIGAGAVMIVTLWRSKKARNVSQTEVQLARQGEGNERFRPNMMSRSIVGLSIKIGEGFSAVLGKNATQWISGRFESKGTVAEGASFDLLRASVNLMTASIIISYATSLKLPLSTTYVTFMVAMGTSLADRAWGKESAVYRVAGVLQVLGGWVFTAITAFIMSGIFASILFYGGKAGLIIALLLAVFSLLRSNKLFKAVEAEVDALPTEAEDQAREALSQRFENHKEVVSDDLRNLDKLITLSLRSLVGSNKDILAETAKRLKSEQKKMEKSFSKLFAKHKEEGGEHIVEFTRLQVESHAKIEDLYRLTRNLVEECLDHVSNYGSMPRRSYLDFILQSEDEMKRYISDVRRQIRSNRPEDSGLLGDKSDGLKETFMNRLNHELDYMANGEVSLRLGKLQVKIILDLMGIVDLGEEVYRKHFDFYRTYVKE